VCGRVDPTSAARNDSEARTGEDPRESFCLLDAIGGGVSGADEGDGIGVEVRGMQVAANIEKWRRIGNGREERGVFRIAERDDSDAEAGGQGQFLLDEPGRLLEAAHHRDGLRLADPLDPFQICRGEREGGLGRSRGVQKSRDQDWTEPGGQGQSQEVGHVGRLFGHAAECNETKGITIPAPCGPSRPLISRRFSFATRSLP
jgi:hypothetical protein